MGELGEKIEALLEELKSRGMEFSTGQHAIVCNDAVVILDIAEDGVGIVVVNNRIDLDYTLGVTDDEVMEFKALAEMESFLEE